MPTCLHANLSSPFPEEELLVSDSSTIPSYVKNEVLSLFPKLKRYSLISQAHHFTFYATNIALSSLPPCQLDTATMTASATDIRSWLSLYDCSFCNPQALTSLLILLSFSH
jgi:hypothetical protein